MKTGFVGVFVAAVGLMGLSVPLAAHHGAASFDTTRELTLKGSVTEWIWANPHCVEVSNPTDMTRLGWARTSFKGGDEVTVTLQPVKSGAPVGRLRSVILPNGQTLSTGGGRGAPSPAPAADK